MIQAHYSHCALYFHDCYTGLYSEIIIQFTIMQNQWESWACFSATRQSHLGVKGEHWGAAVNTDETHFAHLLLCGPVPNRPWTITHLGVGDPCPTLWLHPPWGLQRGEGHHSSLPLWSLHSQGSQIWSTQDLWCELKSVGRGTAQGTVFQLCS